MKTYEVTIKFKFKTETPKNIINEICIDKCADIGESISMKIANSVTVHKPKILTIK